MQEQDSGTSMGTHPSGKGSLLALLLSAGSVEQAGVKDQLGPFNHAFKEVFRMASHTRTSSAN